jgi:dTDP-glucose 4,6-dehydratase
LEKYITLEGTSNTGKDDSKVIYKEAEPFTTRIKTPDSTKAKRDLNFKLSVPVEEGIKRTVEWFREEYGFKTGERSILL